MKIAERMKRIRRTFLYGYRAETKTYIARMERMGARIGENIFMPVPESVLLDKTTPYMLEIGNNVFIAQGASIFTHDASWMVQMGVDGMLRGNIAPVCIGNNVFIGVDSIVTCGVTICDNVIIGANSVVTSDICEPGVYAGSPARFVMSLEKHRDVRERCQQKEAYMLARQFWKRYGKKPDREVFFEYFWLFEPRNRETMPKCFQAQMGVSGNEELVWKQFLNSKPKFNGYDAFWKWCEQEMGREMKEEKISDPG